MTYAEPSSQKFDESINFNATDNHNFRGALSDDGSDSEDFLNNLNDSTNDKAEEVPIGELIGSHNVSENYDLDNTMEQVTPLKESRMMNTNDLILPSSMKKQTKPSSYTYTQPTDLNYITEQAAPVYRQQEVVTQTYTSPMDLTVGSSNGLPLGTKYEKLYASRASRVTEEPYQRNLEFLDNQNGPVNMKQSTSNQNNLNQAKNNTPTKPVNNGPGAVEKLKAMLNANDENQVMVLASSVLGALILTLIFLVFFR